MLQAKNDKAIESKVARNKIRLEKKRKLLDLLYPDSRIVFSNYLIELFNRII